MVKGFYAIRVLGVGKIRKSFLEKSIGGTGIEILKKLK